MNLEKNPTLFGETSDLLPDIPGMTCLVDYIDPSEQDRLFQIIDALPWITDLKRRVQHYGYKYDYKNRVIDSSGRLGSLPRWAGYIATRLHQDGLVEVVPDQLIVNEYQPGQGIASHIDRATCFGETVIILSLLSTVVMDFTQAASRERHAVLLKPRSLIVLKGPARYEWKHGIAARKKDCFEGRIYPRSRRISMTFRKVLLSRFAE